MVAVESRKRADGDQVSEKGIRPLKFSTKKKGNKEERGKLRICSDRDGSIGKAEALWIAVSRNRVRVLDFTPGGQKDRV